MRVPPHRYTPLKDNWEGIIQPLVDHMKLQVRMNTKTRCVELKVSCLLACLLTVPATGRSPPSPYTRSIITCSFLLFLCVQTSPYTVDAGALQKGEDFLKAFMLGFDLNDAVALLRLDDLYVESFEVTDVKPLKGDHLSRAIGRIAGIGGKTKYAIENATRTRIVVAESKVHILGAFSNIQIARDAVCSLILGAPPGKVYNQMRTVASRIGSKQ